jgi:hypothetical protein
MDSSSHPQITQRDLEALRTTMDKLDRTLETFRSEMSRTLDTLRLESAAVYARKDVIDPRLQDIQGDLDEVKGWITWAQRIVLGAVLLALLGAVLVQGGGVQ